MAKNGLFSDPLPKQFPRSTDLRVYEIVVLRRLEIRVGVRLGRDSDVDFDDSTASESLAAEWDRPSFVSSASFSREISPLPSTFCAS